MAVVSLVEYQCVDAVSMGSGPRPRMGGQPLDRPSLVEQQPSRHAVMAENADPVAGRHVVPRWLRSHSRRTPPDFRFISTQLEAYPRRSASATHPCAGVKPDKPSKLARGFARYNLTSHPCLILAD